MWVRPDRCTIAAGGRGLLHDQFHIVYGAHRDQSRPPAPPSETDTHPWAPRCWPGSQQLVFPWAVRWFEGASLVKPIFEKPTFLLLGAPFEGSLELSADLYQAVATWGMSVYIMGSLGPWTAR